MRDLFHVEREERKRFIRRTGPNITAIYGSTGDETCGAFWIRKMTKRGQQLFKVIVSSDDTWEHVSVVPADDNRCATWDEMSYVAGLIFLPDEVLVQYRPAEADYVNVHPHCLHWWRYVPGIPTPPTIQV